MERLKKLQQIRATKDPAYAAQFGFQEMFSNLKGEPGYTPVKGKDYFTHAEVEAIIAQVIKVVLARVPRGRDGYSPVKNRDYRDGKDGVTPVRGVDYWTDADRAHIVAEVSKRIPKPQDPPALEDIVAEAVSLLRASPVEYKDIKNAPDLKSLAELVAFLRAGGFRGGGGGSTGSGTFYTDTVTGTIDGVNRTFSVANTITTALTLQLANSVYQPGVDFTTSGTTITMTVAPDVSLSGQPFWLLHT